MRYAFYPGCSFDTAAGYRPSVTAVCDRLGVELVELSDWNCCGATVFFALDEIKALALAGRVFALAATAGFDTIVTGCNACYTTLRKAGAILDADPALRGRVNGRLAGGGLSLGDAAPRVRHLLDVLAEDIPEETFGDLLTDAYRDLPVAAYYGCQFSRPWNDAGDAEYPEVLERLLERCGFAPVAHSAGTLCCGASHSVAYSEACRPLSRRILDAVREKQGRVVATICPLCQFNLDQVQIQSGSDAPVPVLFFTQIMGLALGIDPSQLGLDRLLVSFEEVAKAP